MTRTERATFPRALVRDRSESKSGLDKSLRKGGNGGHNWGGLLDASYHGALEGEEQALATADERRDSLDKNTSERSNSLTEEEKRLARDFRKTALKGQDIDLSAIARTSAAVSNSPTTRNAVPMV
ncbi:hypothetical protein EV363DRAFT_406390 [Boletus edulis]|uniref:Hyaluronan/mRNA-binding protein domain-containing protein n=1 Tax=Boletus edulis BED1 TaxID=1328754 RepID=A0AAD4G6Z0_BOLED|nr:hypothetical protein EV363DRAFT_406390 [Boletus edulis]KAF8418136.1 hypothetical protein L210DRAFT_2449149 [Boletus edulis BED1]